MSCHWDPPSTVYSQPVMVESSGSVQESVTDPSPEVAVNPVGLARLSGAADTQLANIAGTDLPVPWMSS